MNKTRPDFVLLSETLLKPNNTNKLPNFVGYTAEQKHRITATTGGGLGVLIKIDIYYQNANSQWDSIPKLGLRILRIPVG